MLELILVVALVILVVGVYKPVSKALFGILDGHASKVKKELDDARRLHEEAQSRLAEYRRQLTKGKDQARTMVDQARTEAERMTERHQQELEGTLQRRSELASARIAQAEARAVLELRAYATQLAMRTTEMLLRQQIDAERASALVDQAIADVQRKLA